MNMKKIAPLALSALLLGSVSVGAESLVAPKETSVVTQQSAFIHVTGKIGTVEKFGDGLLYIIDNEENPFQFVVDATTLVYDSKGNKVEVKKGDTVSLYMPADQMMILIYPPRYSPTVVIVQNENELGLTKVANFDKNYLSDDGKLKLNLHDETVIVNAKGDKVAKEELAKKSAIVFYNVTSRSIPAQASPDKIVVFPKYEDAYVPEVTEPTIDYMAEIKKLVGKDSYIKNGKTMVPLRLVAEKYGYKVIATKTGAILQKGAVSYTLTRGNKAYGYNKALRQFDVAPQLSKSGKTYVEVNFMLQIVE